MSREFRNNRHISEKMRPLLLADIKASEQTSQDCNNDELEKVTGGVDMSGRIGQAFTIGGSTIMGSMGASTIGQAIGGGMDFAKGHNDNKGSTKGAQIGQVIGTPAGLVAGI